MNDKQSKLLEAARKLIGTPYKYAAKPEEIPTVIDCSSFTQYIYEQLGVNLKRSTILQATQGKEIKPTTDDKPRKASSPTKGEARQRRRGKQQTTNLEVGDLLFFRGSKGHYNDDLFPGKEIYIGHVAIYIGNDKAIHAASDKGVVEEDINEIIKERGAIVIIKRMI